MSDQLNKPKGKAEDTFDYGQYEDLAKKVEAFAKEYYKTWLRGKSEVFAKVFSYLLKFDLDTVESLVNDLHLQYQETHQYDRVDACDELFDLIRKYKRQVRKKSM